MTTQAFKKWNNIQLSTLLSAIFSGGTPSTKDPLFWSEELPWLSSGETRNRYIKNTEKSITQLAVENSSTRLAVINDVVIATAGQGLTRGQVSFLYIDTYINQSLIALRTKKSLLPKFLFYNLLSRYEEIRGLSDGSSSRGSITIPMLSRLEIKLPDIETQKQITDVLSTYDDLIENNNRRIKILENMAQKIYTEWFVNFHFPGYEKVEFGKDGLPVGWVIESLSSISVIQFGYNYKAKSFTEKEVGNKVVRIRDILDRDSKTFSIEFVDNKYKIEVGDVLIGMDGIFHMRMWSEKNCFLVQRVAGIRSSLPSLYIIESIKKQLDYLQKTIVGATVGHLSNGNIRDFKIITPKDRNILNIFEELTREVIHLEILTKNLQKSRDLLIPQLVTGKLELK